MTLTAVLPSLRRLIPDPLNVDRWPELTHATQTDVVISGISMVRLAEICETPCIHSGAAVIPHSGGRPSSTEVKTVAMVTVVSVTTSAHGRLQVELDGCFGRVSASWGETRLIGRLSPSRHVIVHVLANDGSAADLGLMLPADINAGDLLAIPCDGMVVRRQLRLERAVYRTVPGRLGDLQ